MRKLVLFCIAILAANILQAQDIIEVNNGLDNFNHSITDKLTIYKVEDTVSYDYFLNNKNEFKGEKLAGPIANLDFTTSTYYIHFVIKNNTSNLYPVRLETARSITNVVNLYYVPQKLESLSGDGIPFVKKAVKTNRSVLPLVVQPNAANEYILKLKSDGEIISLPFILWHKKHFEAAETRYQFLTGIFYGIFLFVVLIYLTFYAQLKDKLFLLYSFYVLSSGLLQFSLDGYTHQFIFRSGGYLTQHAVIVISASTVFLALNYAAGYLKLEGRKRRITLGFSWFVVATMLASLVPGKVYEVCYPLINGLSLIAIIYLLFVAFQVRKSNKEISNLFFIGLSVLLAGAVIFILGNFSVIDIPTLTQNSLKASTLIEIIFLSILMAGKYRKLQEEKEKAQEQLLIELEARNKLIEETNVRLEEEVKERTKEIESQRLLLKEKNEDMLSSIKYAERIQSALLSNEQKFKSILPESFILFKPKDIVSGDFYWIEEIEPTEKWPDGLIVYATADCTGHGVPGAFVSIICNNLLKLGKNDPEVQTPGQVLDFVNAEINKVLNSNYSDAQIRDGMDVALCALDRKNMKLYFAGAKNGIYIVRKGELIEIKADRRAIGNTEEHNDFSFETKVLELEKGDMLYTLSDGYVDQFGGPNQKKFMAKRLKDILLTCYTESLEKQLSFLDEKFEDWKAGVEQIDDVLVVGVKI